VLVVKEATISLQYYMKKKIAWNKIARYVSGNISAKEKKNIEEKMNSDEVFKNTVKEAQQAWDLSVQQQKKWNTNKAWQQVQKKLTDNGTPGTIDRSLSPKPTRNRNTGFSFDYMARVAAIVLVVAITSIIFYQSNEGNGSKQVSQKQPKVLVTEKGEQKSFLLSDGTKITLAPDSRISLPKEYQTGLREVTLEGEAFFDVTTNPDHPFKVHVGETITEVLGTQFNIISYPQDQSVKVVVVEGSVGLRAKNTDEQLLLKPGELGSYTSDHKLTSKKVDVNTYTGWKNGQLIFEDQPLNEVVTRLERWYDLSFVINDSAIEKRKLTATFARRQPLREVLDAMALSLDITYTRNDASVHFQQKQ
jgi:ferric-dicitrate binding protein FerR (iron transport regulator)